MAPADSPRTTRAVKLRFILTAVILVALIPPLFLLSLAIWRAGEADRAAANAQFLSQARAMSSMFASALRANIAVVHAVAELDNDTGGSIDRLSGVSSIFSAEIAPTGADPAYPAAPAEAGGWTASNLFGIETGVKAKLAITLRTGFGDGDTLTLVMDPRQLTRALRFDTGAYGQTLVAVVDGNGRVIARSREEDRFIGAPVPTWNALLDVNAPSGIFKAELLEGDTITFAFSTIPGTPGWVVVAGVPSAILDTRWGEPLRYFVGGSIAAVLAGAGLALLVASRIARPLSALAAYAETTTGGTPGTPPGRTPISEYETLRDTLIEAQHRLLDRANRLAVSEARYRAVAKIGAVVTWRQSVSGDLFELEGWEDLTGRPAEPMLGNGWTRTIHPDDLPSITEQWRASLASLAPLDFECRVQLAESDWLYVRVRGTCLRDATGAPAEWAGTVENIHARKLRELRDYHLAFHDELTDLPNRGLMRERLDLAMMAACEGKLGALLYVDLDYFKQANDTYGHAMGDALLRAVAQRLRGLLRAGDTAARIGGDEFAVVLADIDDLGAATATGARIVRSLSSPFELDGATIRIGASIGIALVDGQVPVAEVQKRADMALYGAKGAGRNRYAVYDPDRYERRLA